MKNNVQIFFIFGGIPFLALSVLQTLDWFLGPRWSNFPLNSEIAYRICLPIAFGLVGCVAAFVLCLIQHTLSVSFGKNSNRMNLKVLASVSIPIFCVGNYLAWGFVDIDVIQPYSFSQTLDIIFTNTLTISPIVQLIAIAIGALCALVFSVLHKLVKSVTGRYLI